MIDERFVFLAALFSVVGTTTYITLTIKGRTKPNRVSWFFFGLAPLIAFGAQLDEGVGLSSLMTFMVGFGPMLVLASSFVNKQSYWRLNRLDYACGGLSLLALALWLVTQTGEIAIALSIAADFSAGVPMLIKAYLHPKTESATAFLFGIGNSGITLLTLDKWDFATAGFPIYIFVFCVAIVLIILKLHRNPVAEKLEFAPER